MATDVTLLPDGSVLVLPSDVQPQRPVLLPFDADEWRPVPWPPGVYASTGALTPTGRLLGPGRR